MTVKPLLQAERLASTEKTLAESREDAWELTFGRAWRWHLGALGLLLVIAGTLAPLATADLPMHLALGEWIVRHRAIPFEEPFAWTRPNEPFYAYSWAIQVLYY